MSKYPQVDMMNELHRAFTPFLAGREVVPTGSSDKLTVAEQAMWRLHDSVMQIACKHLTRAMRTEKGSHE